MGSLEIIDDRKGMYDFKNDLKSSFSTSEKEVLKV